MTEQNGFFNGNQACPDPSAVLFADGLELTDAPEIILDGTHYPIPHGMCDDVAFHVAAINEQLESRNYTDVAIWLGKFWMLPSTTVDYMARCFPVIRECGRFISCDGSTYASPVKALKAIAAERAQVITSDIRDVAVTVAAAWYRNDVGTIESELEELIRGTRLRIPKDLRVRVERALRRLESNPDETPSISELLDDASIDSDLCFPPGWIFDKEKNMTFRLAGPVKGEIVDFIDGVLFVVGKYFDVDQEEEYLELVSWSHGKKRETRVGRKQLQMVREVEALSGRGLPVSSINSKLIVTFFSDYFRANEFRIPFHRMVSHLGWINTDPTPLFMLGETPIVPSDPTTAVPNVSPSQTDVAVVQIARRFSVAGDRTLSLRLLNEISEVPVAWFAILAGLSTPLLRVLGIDGFIVDICGETSSGKTTALMMSASMWGNPDIRCADSVVVSWDLTRVYGERLASIMQSLPVCLDDSRRAPKPEVVAQMVYDLAGGRGKGRGNPTSIDAQRSWNLVGISTGEQSLVGFMDQPGMRARILTCRGYPFTERNEQWRQKIELWLGAAKANYGHVGREFVQFIVDSHSDWPTWKERVERIKQALSTTIATNAVAGRHLSYVAVITLTAELVSDLFQLPADRRHPVDGVRHLLEHEYIEADRPREGMEKVLDYVFSNPQLIDPQAYSKLNNQIGMKISMPGDPPRRSSLAIMSHEFDQLMGKFGLSRDEMLMSWNQREWLHLGEGGRMLKNVRFKSGQNPVRAVCIKAVVIEHVRPNSAVPERIGCGNSLVTAQSTQQ